MEEEEEAKNKKRTASDGEESEHEDRLNNLPDHIIQDILSFLETKQAIKTSILCKNFQSHWKHVPVLDFDRQSFSKADSFKKFVSSILSHGPHQTPITKLRYVGSSSNSRGKPILARVFRYVLENNSIEHLVMDASEDSYFLPRRILSCRPLKTLGLCSFVLPKSFSPSTVAVLRLRRCSFSVGLRGRLNPFAGCPNLKDLSLIDVDFLGCKFFKISAPQLLSLTIMSTTRSSNGRLPENCVFEISAPKLTSFSYKTVAAAMNFVKIDLPCLQYVDIAFSLPLIRSKEAYLSLIKLLEGLHNSQFVSLTTSTIMALNTFPDVLENQPSPFNNLKSLKLKPNGECTSFMNPIMVTNYLCSGSPSVEVQLL